MSDGAGDRLSLEAEVAQHVLELAALCYPPGETEGALARDVVGLLHAPPPAVIPTVNGNTVRSFSTQGQLSAAQGSSATVSRSDIRLIQYFDSTAHGLVRNR